MVASRRLFLFGTALVTITGCKTFQPVTDYTPAAYVERPDFCDVLRVETLDERRVDLRDFEIADTAISGSRWRGNRSERLTLPTDSVASVELRECELILVKTTSGETYRLTSAHVTNGSLTGRVSTRRPSITVPLDSIAVLEARRINTELTVLYSAGLAATLVVTVIGLAFASSF